jgi:translocator protein
MKKRDVLRASIAVFVCELAGIIGSVFTIQSVSSWYPTLNRPPFTPPNWIFAPAWTILYALMGVSLYIIWDKGPENKKNREAVAIFGAQLALNVLWSVLFFGLRSPLLALAEMLVLWPAIVLTYLKFREIDKNAGLLLVPYLLWTTFAAVLNYSIVILN